MSNSRSLEATETQMCNSHLVPLAESTVCIFVLVPTLSSNDGRNNRSGRESLQQRCSPVQRGFGAIVADLPPPLLLGNSHTVPRSEMARLPGLLVTIHLRQKTCVFFQGRVVGNEPAHCQVRFCQSTRAGTSTNQNTQKMTQHLSKWPRYKQIRLFIRKSPAQYLSAGSMLGTLGRLATPFPQHQRCRPAPKLSSGMMEGHIST